ncbi:hypothetical protein [Terrarubrum flagellatum]|uniref:hypothetical protein n=1 Tax=Terrirubrum flagellatum TaxID=2895980 RepID=UPI00314536D8
MISGRGPSDPVIEQDDQLLTYPFVVVRVGCKVCNKVKRYRLARLVETFGADATMAHVLDRITINCPWRMDRTVKGRIKKPITDEKCGAYYLDLEGPRPPPDDPAAPSRPTLVHSVPYDHSQSPREIKRLRRALRG